MFDYPDMTQGDLEREIARITGVSVGPTRSYPKPFIQEEYYSQVDSYVRDWMRHCGVDEYNIRKMSDKGRCNCYCAGAQWTRTTIQDHDAPPKRTRTRPGFGKVDTHGFTFDDAPKKELADELGLPKSVPSFDDETRTDLGEGKSDEEKITITQTMLRNATNAILEPQVKELQQKVVDGATVAIRQKLAELDQDIEQRVKVEIAGERTEATNKAIKAATDVAVQAALQACEDFINKRVPRRIELYTPKATRVLTDEPRHKAFDEILFWAAQGIHVYMWGPRGTGKTHLMPQVCEALGRKYTPIGQSLSKYDVTGYNSATGDYIKTHARDAMEFGHCLGVDEGDAWAAAALIALNTPLANKYCPFPDKIIQVHPDFLCLLCANTSGFGATPEYQGRNPLDSTSTDRFVFVPVDYDEDLEIQIFGNTPWVRYVHEVRRYVRSTLKVTAAIPSMRPLLQGTAGLAAGGDPAMVTRAVLWKALPQDMINKIETACGKFERKIITEASSSDDPYEGADSKEDWFDEQNEFEETEAAD